MPGLSPVRHIRGISLAGLKWTRPAAALLALLFVVPLAATAQGSMCLTRISAIRALSTGTIAEVANLITIVIEGYGFSHLSPRLVELANKSFSTCNYGGELRPPYGGYSPSNRTAIVGTFCGQCADDNFILEGACRDASRLSLGHSFGTSPAPDNTTPLQTSCDLSQKADHRDHRHLGAGPLAQLRRVRPEQQQGEFNKRRPFHVPEQNIPQPRPD